MSITHRGIVHLKAFVAKFPPCASLTYFCSWQGVERIIVQCSSLKRGLSYGNNLLLRLSPYVQYVLTWYSLSSKFLTLPSFMFCQTYHTMHIVINAAILIYFIVAKGDRVIDKIQHSTNPSSRIFCFFRILSHLIPIIFITIIMLSASDLFWKNFVGNWDTTFATCFIDLLLYPALK